MFGTSDAWLMSRLSKQTSDQAYYIKDCRIYGIPLELLQTNSLIIGGFHLGLVSSIPFGVPFVYHAL